MITGKELNHTHREFIAERERADLLSDSTLHRTREQASSKQRLPSGALKGFYSYRADISWLVLAGFYCLYTNSYITLNLLHMWPPMVFLDRPPGKGSHNVNYYNAIIMKQGSRNIFCAFTSHHDSVLFQKTGVRTGSLSCTHVLCLRPGALPEFPPSYLLLHNDVYLGGTFLGLVLIPFSIRNKSRDNLLFN